MIAYGDGKPLASLYDAIAKLEKSVKDMEVVAVDLIKERNALRTEIAELKAPWIDAEKELPDDPKETTYYLTGQIGGGTEVQEWYGKEGGWSLAPCDYWMPIAPLPGGRK